MKLSHMRIAVSAMLAAGLLAGSVSAAFAADKMLADRHVQRGLKCDACHTTAAGGPLKAEKSDYGVCATCHGDYDAMVKKTAAKAKKDGDPNPHAQHDGALPCTECHHAHKKGTSYCSQCHTFVYKIP